MAIASAVGLDPLMGVVAGSIALVGGLGTAGAWGPILRPNTPLKVRCQWALQVRLSVW